MRALALLLTLATPALAQDIEPDITYDYYEINSDTLYEVLDEIAAEGPQGFTAYTTWNVTWTADCELSVTATITLPELADDADLSENEEAEFYRMLEALEQHELGHVEMGVGFAEDVEEAGCPADTSALHEAWLEAERDYDDETEHGRTQGAWLNVE